jgi:hypothetical protein
MLCLIYIIPCICLFTAKVRNSKYDDLEQQVRHLQSVVNASNIQSNSQNDSLSTTAGLCEQAPDSPRLFLSEAMSLSQPAPPPIQTSLNGGVGLPESAHPSSVSYQAETFSGSPYQSSTSFQAGATGPSLPEPRSIGSVHLTSDQICRLFKV